MTRLMLTVPALLAVGSAVVGISIRNRHNHDPIHEGREVQRAAEAAGRSHFALVRSKDGDARQTSGAETEAPKGSRTKEGDPEPIILKADESIYRLAWGPDGKRIAVVGVGYDQTEKGIKSTLRFWDAEKREVRRSVDVESMTQLESIAFSPDGKMLAIAAIRRAGKVAYAVRLIDAETGATRKTIPLQGTVRSVVYSPNGKMLAIGGQDIPEVLTGPFARTVQLWDVEKERTIREFRQELRVDDITKSGQLDGLRDLQFSPDGKLVAAADVDFRVRLIDVRTGGVQRTLQGHTEVVLALAFSPDGKALASAGFDRTVRIWDAQTGTEIRTLQGNKGQVWRVAFSPDGKLMATGGMFVANGTRSSEVILWDAHSWQPRRVLPGDKGSLETPAFSPDNKLLAVGVGTEEGAGAIQLWQLGDLLQERR
jgi:WD40 repeat protein